MNCDRESAQLRNRKKQDQQPRAKISHYGIQVVEPSACGDIENDQRYGERYPRFQITWEKYDQEQRDYQTGPEHKFEECPPTDQNAL